MKVHLKTKEMKYIITSIQLGARLNKNFYSNMLKFKKEHNVDKILVFVMNGKYIEEEMHPSVATLDGIEFINSTYRLNQKVLAYDTKTLAQNIHPTQGQENKLPSEYSYVMPGTKRRYHTLPSIGTKPRFFASTGAMTEANYITIARSSGMRVKRGLQAEAQHQFGFVYFQDDGRGKFDIYQVLGDKSGNFYYLNERYRSGKLTIGKYVEALILGDWHHGDTNPEIRTTSIKMIETLKPKIVVFHDIMDGYSVNHHKQGRLLESLRTGIDNKHKLEDELKLLLKEINFFASKFPKVQFVVPESNHDVFIRTYLDNKYHHNDTHNYLQCIKIIPRVLDNRKVVLEEALLTVGELPDNFLFLREDDPYRVGGDVKGIALGQHGHKGTNGSRGSAQQFMRTNAKMITGHTHSPQIYENGMIVGTSTWLQLDYTIGGLSSWLNAHGILYPNMTYGLLTLIPKKSKRTK